MGTHTANSYKSLQSITPVKWFAVLMRKGNDDDFVADSACVNQAVRKTVQAMAACTF